jgi:hypothetical protein
MRTNGGAYVWPYIGLLDATVLLSSLEYMKRKE